jgi:restriction system protein
VGRPDIQKFFGALHGQRATKRVVITTSSFSREAVEYAEGVIPRMILIDGQELTQLMIEHTVGVIISREYKLTRPQRGCCRALDLTVPHRPELAPRALV